MTQNTVDRNDTDENNCNNINTTHNKNEIIGKQTSMKVVKLIKPRINSDDFKILGLDEYEKLHKYNYNIKQLREMCKHYKLKVSGNKGQLHNRLYHYMSKSVNIIKIQKVFRGHIVRKYMRMHGPAFKNRKLCVNETDFFTLDELDEIPHYQFYSFKDVDGFIYGFDICSIYNHFKINCGKTLNPYNRNEFPKDTLKNIRKLLRFSHLLKFPINISIQDPEEHINRHQQLNNKITSLFQSIDDLGFYSQTSWLHNLCRNQHILFIRHLYDIWVYRAQMTDETRFQICPGTGNPFFGLQIRTIHLKTDEIIKTAIATIIENLVTKGVDNGSKWLGASYCLSALTLVSNEAAEALPWLYQSVAP